MMKTTPFDCICAKCVCDVMHGFQSSDWTGQDIQRSILTI